MSHRFFSDQPIATDRATLTGPEAHHLLHVMRATVGQCVTLFDGSGREYRARVDQLRRSEVELEVMEASDVDREADRRVIIAVTLPKADRQKWLIEKLTEIGVARLVPLRSERSSVHPEQRHRKKLERGVIEASKQCGRNRLMQISALTHLSDFLVAAPRSATRVLADPSGQVAAVDGVSPRPCRSAGHVASIYAAIGPEGGFTAQERETAVSAGWTCVSLGSRMLRIETACVVLASLILHGPAGDG
jgi:16S rRNA (uracil1498-N3)-methyltransferase